MRVTMPGGGRLSFGHLERDQDAEVYMGASYTRVYIEEAGNFPNPGPIMKLFATLRSGAGVPCRMRLTGNPGGPGHAWVRARYIDPAPQGWEIIKDEATGRERVFIPSRVQDNTMIDREAYISNLKQSGNEELVRAWLDGDWSAITGAYFPEFSTLKHVCKPVELPKHWMRYRAFDWGSAKPFCCLWIAIADGTTDFPSGTAVVYREWYGSNGEPNVGLRMTAEEVCRGILQREAPHEAIQMSVCDPAMFKVDGGPSMAERMPNIPWHAADNSRIAGWDQVRGRLRGTDGVPSMQIFNTCIHIIRTLPEMQHDEAKPEDLESDSDDHAVDALRYGFMARPWLAVQDKVKPAKDSWAQAFERALGNDGEDEPLDGWKVV